MKRQALRTITTSSFLLVLAAVSVSAQELCQSRVSVNIPFDFAIGETKLPSGHYTLRRIISTSSAEQLLIRSEDGRVEMPTGITRPNRASEIQKQSKLVFNRYGDQYFLSQAGQLAVTLGANCSRAVANAAWRRK